MLTNTLLKQNPVVFYGLRNKTTGLYATYLAVSNAGTDAFTDFEYRLEPLARPDELIWLVTAADVAEKARVTDTVWSNAFYETPSHSRSHSWSPDDWQVVVLRMKVVALPVEV